MSGLDEQLIIPPECPSCGNCRFWLVGRNTWLMTERPIKEYGLRYSILILDNRQPSLWSGRGVSCSECATVFEVGNELHSEIIRIFKSQYGGKYHTSFDGDVSDKWEEEE